MKNKIRLLLFMLTIIFSVIVKAQVRPQLTFTQFCTFGTGARPTDIKNCGDSRLFILLQHGTIRIVDSAGNISPTPFLDITTKVLSTGNEQGLLGLAFSPNFATDSIFYIDYTAHVGAGGGVGNTTVARYHLSRITPNVADTTEEILLSMWDPYTNHNGGDLAFGHDGYLYLGYGDGGNGGDPQNRAQNLDSLWGKILRIDVSHPGAYTIPLTNPFITNATARHEIWAYGVRNPWRWSFDRITHDLWIGDVGQDLWEEVDFQSAAGHGGENYGWHCYEGLATYSNCTPPDVTWPVYVYAHNGSPANCSVTGGYVYRGAKYGDLFGRYLLTDYCSGRFESIRPDGSGGWIVDSLTTSSAAATNDYSAFGEDFCGELFIAGNSSGKIWKIGDTTCTPTAYILNNDTIMATGSVVLNALQGCNTGYSFQWYINSNIIAGAASPSYTATQCGNYTVKVNNGTCSRISPSVNVTILPLPTVNFSGLDTSYCSDAAQVVLTGNPPGGIFSGTGISGNMFDPVAAGTGTFNITYTYSDSVTLCSNFSFQQVTVDVCTGINEPGVATNVSLYPNPNRADFTFEFNLYKNESVEIEITDVLSRVYLDMAKELPKGNNYIPVNMNNAFSGVYIILLKTDHGQIIRKFIVNKL